MTLSERLALDAIADLKFDNMDDMLDNICGVLIIARDNGNWELIDDLASKILAYSLRH